MTEKDEMIILPPSMAHDIRNDPNLGFNPFIAKVHLYWTEELSVFHATHLT